MKVRITVSVTSASFEGRRAGNAYLSGSKMSWTHAVRYGLYAVWATISYLVLPSTSVVADALRLYLCLSVSYFGNDLARILWYSRPLFMSKVLATRVTVIHCPLEPWQWLRVIKRAKSNDQTVFICNTYSGASETFTHCCTFLFVILLSLHYVSIRLSNPKRFNPFLTTRIKRQLVAQQWCKPKAQPSRMWRFDAVFRSNMSQSLSRVRNDVNHVPRDAPSPFRRMEF